MFLFNFKIIRSAFFHKIKNSVNLHNSWVTPKFNFINKMRIKKSSTIVFFSSKHLETYLLSSKTYCNFLFRCWKWSLKDKLSFRKMPKNFAFEFTFRDMRTYVIWQTVIYRWLINSVSQSSGAVFNTSTLWLVDCYCSTAHPPSYWLSRRAVACVSHAWLELACGVMNTPSTCFMSSCGRIGRLCGVVALSDTRMTVSQC